MAGSLGPEGSLYLFSKGAAVLELYEILQVSPKAEPEVIQAAYKALARKYHPDHHPDKALAQQKMIRINEAYEVLGDPERRRRYDAGLEGSRRMAPPSYDGKRFGRARVVDGKGKEHDVTVLEMDLSRARVRASGALKEVARLVLSLGLSEAPVTVGVRSAEGRGDEWTLRFEPLGAVLPRVVAYLEKAG
jgi:curved DNA-binding protein CbpA